MIGWGVYAGLHAPALFFSCVGGHRWPFARSASVVGDPIGQDVPTFRATRIPSFVQTEDMDGSDQGCPRMRSATGDGSTGGQHGPTKPKGEN